MKTGRLLALLILVIPGMLSIYGVKVIRDALFISFGPEGFQWGLLLLGIICLGFGLTFIGGYLYFGDKKRNYRPKFKDDLHD